MFEFSRIKTFLFLMLVLQFTAAAEGLLSSFTVRAGQEVTLPCENVIDDQQNCDITTWLFSDSRQRAAVELITLGQIGKSKSDRLSVTQKCSLVIKKVTDEDVGSYTCQQWKSGQRQQPESQVDLSVVTMTEHKSNDQVVLNCSVSTYGRCPHTVKWLYAGKDVDKDNKDLQTSQSGCSAFVRFQSSHFIHKSNSDLLKCEVIDGNKVQQLFPFRLQPSGEKPGDDTRKTTTESSLEGRTITTASPINDALRKLKDSWWLFIIAAVLLVALIITAVKVIRCKRAKGNNARMNDDIGLMSNSTVTQSAPETSQDTADPEGGVSYASISYTRKPDSEARVQTKNKDDEEDAVTYMTVKVSSTDPSSPYARIN